MSRVTLAVCAALIALAALGLVWLLYSAPSPRAGGPDAAALPGRVAPGAPDATLPAPPAPPLPAVDAAAPPTDARRPGKKITIPHGQLQKLRDQRSLGGK